MRLTHGYRPVGFEDEDVYLLELSAEEEQVFADLMQTLDENYYSAQLDNLLTEEQVELFDSLYSLFHKRG